MNKKDELLHKAQHQILDRLKNSLTNKKAMNVIEEIKQERVPLGELDFEIMERLTAIGFSGKLDSTENIIIDCFLDNMDKVEV